MLEVENIRAINKGNLLATCDVHIKPWRTTLHDIKIFQKGNSRWISLPSKEYTNDAGEKKYTELVTFDNDGIKERFRDQIMRAVEAYIASNPDLKPEDIIKEDDTVPF